MKQILQTSDQTVTDGAAIVPRGFTPSSTEPARVRGFQQRDLDCRRRPLVSPSLRIRATRANRSLLRWMREAELAAWQEAGHASRRALNFFPR